MAEKVTTLRLKAVGFDESATAVEAANRVMLASNVRVEASFKALAKATDALDANNTKSVEAYTKARQRNNDEMERSARITSRLVTTDPVKQLQNRSEDVARTLANDLANEKLNADQKLALRRVAVTEQSKIMGQIVEIDENSWREQADIARKEGATRYAEQAKADAEILEEEASNAAEIQKFREKSAEAGMKIQLKVNAQEYKDKVKADAEAVKEAEETQANLLKFREKSGEAAMKLQLRLNADEYKEEVGSKANLQAFVEKSAEDGMKLQMQINKRAAEDARREARVQQKLDEENGGGLSGFGGRMILGMAAGRAAGDIIGDRHGGQEIGSIISGFMFGGPEIGAAIAGMELIGQAFKSMRENTEAAAKGAEEYTKALGDLSKEWSHLGTDMAKGDTFEQSLKKIIGGSQDRGDKARADLAKVVGDDQSSLFPHYDPLNLPAAIRAKDIAGTEDKNVAEAREFEKAERANRLEDQKKIFAAEMDLTKAEGMGNGQLKEQAELTARIAVEHAKIEAHHREEVAQSDAALKISNEIVDQSEKRSNDAIAANAPFGDKLALQEAVDEAKRNLAEAQDARAQMDAQYSLDTAEQAQKDAAEKAGNSFHDRKGKDLASDNFTGVVGSGQTGNRYIDFKAFDMNAKPVDPTVKSIDNSAKKIAENTDPKKNAESNGSMDAIINNSASVISQAKHSSKDITPDVMKHAPKGPGYAALLAGLTDMTLESDGLYYQEHTTGRKARGDPTGGIGAAGLTPEQYKRLVDANIERQKPSLLQKSAAGKSSIDKAWLDAQRQMDHNWMHTDQAKATGTQFKKLSPHDQFMKDYVGMDPVQRAALEAGKARLWADHHPEDDPNQVAALKAGQYAHQKALNAARAPGMNGDPSGNGVPLWEGANQRAALSAGQERLKSDAFHKRWGENAVMPSHLGPTGSGAITSQQVKTPEQANAERMVKLLEIIAQKIGIN